MKKRSIISVLLAFVLIFTLTSNAFAVLLGDVDKDGKVSSSDARLTLRAAVGLEYFTDEQKKLANADGDEECVITAADARLILRASVGLENLGELAPEEEPALMWNGHKVDTDKITIEKGINCIDSECPVEGCNGGQLVPSFNDLVNGLKKPGSLNYFAGYSKMVTVTKEPTAKASSVLHQALASTMKSLLADSIVPGTVIEYTDMIQNRHINNATFFVTGKEYVSALTDSDIKSIEMKKMNGIDFVKSLPASYKSTDSGETFSLENIKAAEIGDVYKVTVTLNAEKVTADNIPTETTPFEKVFREGYNAGIKENMEGLNNSFSEMPELAEMIKMGMEIETETKVVYYFTADSFNPVAAVYYIDMNSQSLIYTYFNNLLQVQSKPTTTITIASETAQENYFFFNDYFKAK